MKKRFLPPVILAASLMIFCVGMIVIFRARPFFNSFEELDEVDQIIVIVSKISNNGTVLETLKRETLNNPEQINQLISKIRTYSTRWQYEEFDILDTGISGRPAPVQILFYNREDPTAFLLIGYTKDNRYFLQSLGQGRYLTENEFQDLMGFLKIDTNFAYYDWEATSP
jgi:hypothetical protein